MHTELLRDLEQIYLFYLMFMKMLIHLTTQLA